MKTRLFLRHWVRFVLVGLLAGSVIAPALADEVNIYSHRQSFLLAPFLKAFEAETGIKANVVYASKGLAQRLAAEGKASPADVVLTVDISRLSEFHQMGLFQEVRSDILQNAIPAHLRAPDNQWFGLSQRTRIIAASKALVAVGEITTIEELADPKWQGRVCSRKGSHVYNRALLASLIAHHGSEAAEAWAKGLVANLARRPQGNDRAQAKAIYAGECDLAIMNHYYYGKMTSNDKEPEQKDWANAVHIIAPNQQDRGAHINISGGGVAKYAPNKQNAVKFLEFLVSDEAQALYAEVNYEFPVTGADKPEIAGLNGFKADDLPIQALSDYASEAQKIIDRVGW